MRRPLSIVMVFLLVLRGLLGDAMAMGAAPVPAAHSASSAEAHHHAPELAQALALTLAGPASQGAHHSTHSDDPAHALHTGHAAQELPQALSCVDGTPSSCGGHEHGASCTLCGICHSALFTPAGIGARGVSTCAALRPQGSERFASAALLQATKPPIS